MNQVAIVSNTSISLSSPIKTTICQTFSTKLRGLMFYPSIAKDEGLLFIEKSDSIINSSIHMFFMSFDIAVIWVNKKFEVVDLVLAKKWHIAYFPSQPACYTLEIHPSRLNEFHVGDKIILENV
jgi:uncharacterized membrane protein (UPF0127 family)